MHFQKFSRLFVAPITCIAFFLSPITSISVSATSTSNEADFWHGFYVEHVTKEISGNGVDIGNAESTDYGLSTANYVYNQSGITVDDVKDYVSQQYENANGYVKEGVKNYTDKVENVFQRTIDGTLSAGYTAEKALRKVVDSAGNVYYNVSSSDYWNGIYNKWFNNNGYADQYIPSDNESYTGEVNGHTFSVNWFGVCSVPANAGIANPASDVVYIPSDCRFASSLNHLPDSEFWDNTVGLSFTIDGIQYYEYIASSFQGWFGGFDGISITGNTYRFNFHWIGRSGTSYNSSITIYFTSNPTNTGTQNNPILQHKQVGFIIYNGNHVPIYTDKTLNPTDWTINDNGTVTIDNDGDYPAYIDEKELSDDAWLDLLNLLDGEDQREMSLKDPWGNPWDTQDDGTALGGFFGNLVKDIQKMFKGIGDKIKEIFEKPIDVLSDLVEKIKKALTEFFTFSPNDLNVDVGFNFNILESIWDAFLEQFGLA